jgi:hypothetical protein
MEQASLAYWRKPKGPPFRVLPLETDKQNSTPGGSLLAFMTANREQPIKDFELTGRWRFTSVDRRFFYWSPHQTVAGSLSSIGQGGGKRRGEGMSASAARRHPGRGRLYSSVNQGLKASAATPAASRTFLPRLG